MPKIDIWGAEGIFAQSFPGFKPRRQQQEMYRTVATALMNAEHALVEGGTGTGKGLAYLTPLILLAYKREEVKAGVSASTINLQEQLMTKDIPQAVKALENAGLIKPGTFRYTTLKGKNNYLCEENRAILEADATDRWPEAERALQKVENWETKTGDRAELQLTQDETYPWTLMSCQYSKACEAYNQGSMECSVTRARAIANQAHLVVMNHAVLLADMAASGPQLGHLTHLVLDEGHHLEAEASRQFGTDTRRRDYVKTLEPLKRDPVLGAVAEEAEAAWEELWIALNEWLHEGTKRRAEAKTIKPETRECEEWTRAEKRSEQFRSRAANLGLALANEIKKARLIGDTKEEGRLRRILDETETVTDETTLTFGTHDPATVRWVEPRDDTAEGITAIPLKVGPILQTHLFEQKKSVIVTSATLTTSRDNFDMLTEQIGAQGARTLRIGSPFNYREQAQVIIPTDMPNPRDWREYEAAAAETVRDISVALNGHTLALYTSNAAIKGTAERIRQDLERKGLTTLAQNIDGAAADLLKLYRDDQKSVILGTNSFWEGVDLADEGMLQSVVVCKLPFPVPSDPVIEARSNLYANGFRDYQVPIAVMRFKQGIGRLIRNDRSHGTIVILDPRFDNKSYGWMFEEALPDCGILECRRANAGEIAAEWQSRRAA